MTDKTGINQTTRIAVAVCPHCGDRTEHEFLLDEFTCGACDRPFRPAKQSTLDLPAELRARAKGNATDRTHQVMIEASELIDRLDDIIARHAAFVRYLRRHLDGFLGDLPINVTSLRKAMDDHGV